MRAIASTLRASNDSCVAFKHGNSGQITGNIWSAVTRIDEPLRFSMACVYLTLFHYNGSFHSKHLSLYFK